MKVLPRSFYERDPAIVARELLGKMLVRHLEGQILSGKIVETEAYYGENDPASKAYMGKKPFNEPMFSEVGRTFIYMVHGNWLLNIVAHPKGEVGAVLIRALEPVQGIETMKKNRKTGDTKALTNGPGKLTKALAITKKLNGVDVANSNSDLTITYGEGEPFEICTSHRIGVKADLPQKLRFYIKGNAFVSRP
ncbi:MAG: DNA-3-methyladenine glycosylase [Candidatus Bathyarchaeia archaeon]